MRLFIAIPIPKDLAKELENFQKEQVVRNIEWTDPRNFHITVQFLGEVEKQHLEEVKERLSTTAKCARMFKLKLKEVAYTDGRIMKNIPARKMVWAVFDGNGEYQKLAATAIGKLREFSNEPSWGEESLHQERLPHITLGRFLPYSSRRHASELKDIKIKDDRSIIVDSFELWESIEDRAVYRPLAKYELLRG